MPVGQEGRRGHAGPHTARSRGHPSLEWPVPLSGTGRFSDFEAEFNYMLSLTSSGDDGTIARVICQRDTCTCNKPKAKRSVSVNAKHTGLGPDPEPLHLRWDTEKPGPVSPPTAVSPSTAVSPPTTTTRHPPQAGTPQTPGKSPSPAGCHGRRRRWRRQPGNSALAGVLKPVPGRPYARQRPGALALPWVRGKATHLKMALSLIVNKDREGKKKTKERK